MLREFEARGCSVIFPPNSKVRTIGGFFEVPAGGNCVHVLAAVAEGQMVSVQFKDPDGKVVSEKGGTVDLEHCPTADLKYDYTVTSEERQAVTAAIVECAAPENFHSHASGFDQVAAAMTRLQALGCRQILMQPKPVSGEQNMEAQVTGNGQCVNVVAATGVEAGGISANIQGPEGNKLHSLGPTLELHVALCSPVAGPHPMQFLPKTKDYYTIGAVSCSSAVTRSLTAKFDRESPLSTNSLSHLISP